MSADFSFSKISVSDPVTMAQTFEDMRDIFDSLATLGAGTITSPRTNHKKWSSNQLQNFNGSTWDNIYPIADWSSLVNKPAFTATRLLFGDGTSTPSTSANVSYNGTTFSALGTPLSNTLRVGAISGGCVALSGQVAGSGGVISGLNSAMTDYEPLQILAEDFSINLRTGVGTNTPRLRLTNTGELVSRQFSSRTTLTNDTNYEAVAMLHQNNAARFITAGHGTGVVRPFVWQTWDDPNSTGVTLMTLTSTGGLGIGTASPSAKIHAISTTEQLRLGYDASNYTTFTNSSLGYLTLDSIGSLPGYIFNVGGTSSLTLVNKRLFLPDGTVSVGAWDTTTTKFQVSAANINATSTYMNVGHNYYYSASNYKYLTNNFASVYSQVDGEHRFQAATSGTADNNITWTTGIRILASGFLGLNVVTPSHPVVVGNDTSNGNGAYCSVTGNWTNGSDRSKKTDIFDLTVGLSEILQLKPCSFRYLNNPELQYGLVAQDVKDVLPALVEGQEPNLALRTHQLIFPIINAIQELAGRVTALEQA